MEHSQRKLALYEHFMLHTELPLFLLCAVLPEAKRWYTKQRQDRLVMIQGCCRSGISDDLCSDMCI